jgi:steroid 5-alpha reductase family enzyme
MGVKIMDGIAVVIAFLFGPVLFAVIVVVGFLAVRYHWVDLSWADYLGAIGAGAGLLTVGHGIHRAARSRE